MINLVDAVADDVVQIHQPLGVVRFDIHQRIDAVVDLGIALNRDRGTLPEGKEALRVRCTVSYQCAHTLRAAVIGLNTEEIPAPMRRLNMYGLAVTEPAP